MEHKEYRKLHAEWYEYLSAASPDLSLEIDFWVRCVQAAGQPVLELGSGTGKILVPLLEKGIDITGIDTSDDMMARCRDLCQAKGLKPQLSEQSMVDFCLPRQFSLAILPSGSLGLFTADKDIGSMFGRVLAHLKPGGTFIYGFEQVPEKPDKNNNNWTGNWARGPGDVVIAWRRHWRYDEASHVWECLFIVERFVGGRLVETEANERTGRFFSLEEAVEYATAAGFAEIRTTDRLTEEPPRRNSASVIVRCRKPA
jgi:SAM-dependent methyltransferase